MQPARGPAPSPRAGAPAPAAMRAALAAAAAAWLRNPWLLWGVGPILASDAGFFATALLFELLLRSGLLDGRLIVYASGGDAPRKALMAKTHARVPFRSQVAGSTWHLLGWVAWGVGLLDLLGMGAARRRGRGEGGVRLKQGVVMHARGCLGLGKACGGPGALLAVPRAPHDAPHALMHPPPLPIPTFHAPRAAGRLLPTA